MTTRNILVTLALLIATSYAQLANSPPVPQWIAAQDGGAVVERGFEWKGKLLKAILLTACEGKAEITINGQAAGAVTGKETAAGVDVTKLVREGANTIALRSASPVAALLELNGDLANTRWIATDAAWQSAGAAVVARGAVDADPTANPFDLKRTFDAYNSWQLAKPGAQNVATDPATITAPEGFKVELIRSAQPGEDSWVSMAFDPQGRITLGKEKKGLLRLTLTESTEPSVEVINDTLLECRSVLYAHGALYANANNSKGLYRLRDLNGDDQYEEVTELLHTEGGVGHGRNHIKLGPDGKIYIAHGNNVLLPKNVSPKSPLRNYANDQLIPNPWDGTMFDGTIELPAGHILRMNADGSEVELLAGGLRNPLDIAFNRHGELFTFDADMERDVGTPWYMPTRVLHVVPGADFGWRRGTGRYPAWYIDTLPSVVDIGLSSPTATFFGHGAKFPGKYQDAYFIMDWSYGRIIAVHLKAKGASYSGEQETFVSGRPLNVTDGAIGPDGAMWFITGGRGTQSGLYRVSFPPEYKGPVGIRERGRRHLSGVPMVRLTIEDRDKAGGWTEDLRFSRKMLETDDPFLRHAARMDLEKSQPERWRKEALEETAGMPGIIQCLALARMGDTASRGGILAKLSAISLTSLKPDEQLALLRVLAVTFARLGGPDETERQRFLEWITPRFPQPDADGLKPGPQNLNRELCRTLVYLKSPTVIEKTLPLLREATASEDLLFYPFVLRYLKDGWTPEARRVCFEALNRAEKLNGASTYFKAIADTRSELAAALTPADAQQFASIIHPPKPATLSPHALPGHSFKNWTLADLAPRLEQVSRGRSHEKAKAALISTQCVFCHKVGNDPALPTGMAGPDLTQVSARFNRHDLLMHILEPSKFIDEKFKSLTVTKSDGSTITGALDSEDDERVVLRPNPLAPEKVEIGKSMIKARAISEVSPMPAGLLNTLKADQILDMLAWFEAGGDAAHRVFKP